MHPDEIRRLRSALGLAQHQLGAVLGVSSMIVSRWELGKGVPTHHQRLLLGVFARAAERDPGAGARAGELLAVRGVAAGLWSLLDAAERDPSR